MTSCEDGTTETFSTDAGSVIGGSAASALPTAFCRIVPVSGSVNERPGGSTIFERSSAPGLIVCPS